MSDESIESKCSLEIFSHRQAKSRESTAAQAALASMGELRGSVDFFRIPIRYRLACLGIVWFDH